MLQSVLQEMDALNQVCMYTQVWKDLKYIELSTKKKEKDIEHNMNNIDRSQLILLESPLSCGLNVTLLRKVE